MTDLLRASAGHMRKRRVRYLVSTSLVLMAGAGVAIGRRGPKADLIPAEVPDSLVAAAEAREQVPVAPAIPRVPKPDVVKGLYLNEWATGSPRRFARLVALADSTEINAFVIDVKEAGIVNYDTNVNLAEEIGAERTEYVRNIRERLDTLRAHDIYPIARIVVFKDPVLAKARPEWAIQKADGSLWADDKGKQWVDTFNKHVWDYNIDLAREAIELGFSEVQWDYVRFPDVPKYLMNQAVWPAQAGRSKEDAVREFLLYSRERLSDLNVPVTADVFGLTVSDPGDMGIGQKWEKFIEATDVVLPMVYPSHFAFGTYGLSNPNARPYATVRRAMEWALERSKPFTTAATIRPWLQAFSAPWMDRATKYGAAEVRAQIQAVYDVGLKEWVLWHPGSQYEPYMAALAREGGEPPQFAFSRSEAPNKKPAPRVATPAAVDSAAATTKASPQPLGKPTDSSGSGMPR